MKRLGFLGLFLLSTSLWAQGVDSDLEGRWELFKIIDNMTGEDLEPSHKSSEEFVYWISFSGNIVRYNIEVNTCENEIIVDKERNIEFKYFSECTKICCDSDFSELLSYAECTNYFIKENKTLIMVSEDRIFYFKRAVLEDK